jgi:hypothetical protein
MSVTGAIIAGIGAAGAIGGGAIASSGAQNAAGAQSSAANYAANLQYQSAQNALQFQQQVYNQQQQNIAPYLQSGYGGLSTLDTLLGITPYQGGIAQGTTIPGLPAGTYSGAPGSTTVNRDLPVYGGQRPIAGPIAARGNAISAMAPGIPTRPGTPVAVGPAPAVGPEGGRGLPTGAGAPPTSAGNPNVTPGFLAQTWNQPFQAPTNVTEQNDPGYQFRLSQGLQALQNSAAAGGGLLTGATAKDINNYAQQYASNEYGNVYNRALGEYQQAYNIFNQNQANLFNRYASIAGLGQTAAQQLNTAGSQAAGNTSNILLGSSQNIGQAAQNAGAATASGYVGGANAWSGALGGATGGLSNMLLLNSLLGGQSMAGASAPAASNTDIWSLLG